MGKKASPALRKALKRHGLEGLIKKYSYEWNLVHHRIDKDPTMDPVERTKQIIETFLTLVEEKLEEESLSLSFPSSR
ncbi:TPA: hypothetical protein EYP13_01000 [Candidatus Micrarchaeota archaeon]|nr:hypothetical protein [Candidatus Micrarchaeota archaeon]